MKSPLFVVFEGIDGSGTTTQATMLYETMLHRRLARFEDDVTLTRDPGGTVVQRRIPRQSGARISGKLRIEDGSTEGRYTWILTRKKSTGNASYFYGFGAAIKKSVSGSTSTTTTADTLVDDASVSATSTADFPSSGAFYLEGEFVTYTGKTDTSLTGCSGVPASTSGATISIADNSLFIVDNGDLGNNSSSYLEAENSIEVKTSTSYNWELLITPPSAASSQTVSTEFRIWENVDSAVRPNDPSISYGSYIPTSYRNNYTEDSHFGVSVHDNDGGQWYYDDIESVAATYPHYLFRLDSSDFRENFKVRAWGSDTNNRLDWNVYKTMEPNQWIMGEDIVP